MVVFLQIKVVYESDSNFEILFLVQNWGKIVKEKKGKLIGTYHTLPFISNEHKRMDNGAIIVAQD